MIPENITKLVSRLGVQSYMDGRSRNGVKGVTRETRQALLAAIEAALSKPAVPEDIGYRIDVLLTARGPQMRDAARHNLEAAIAALANRAGGGVKVPGQFAERVVTACRAYMNTYDVLADEVREHMQVNMADALRASDALASAPVEPMLTADEEAAIVEDINSGRWPYLAPVEPAPAAPGWRVPDGWKLVPAKPTEAMLDAGEGFNIRCGCPECDHTAHEKIAAGWTAMLAAAPTPDSSGTEGGA